MSLNITDLIIKFHTDGKIRENLINNTLRYQFTYNGYTSDLFYSFDKNLHNVLRLIVSVNGVDYLFVEYINHVDGKYTIVPYIDNEIYSKIKFSLLYVGGKCSTTPYFTTMLEQVLQNQPLVFPDGNRNYFRHQHKDYHPYFQTTIRKTMSERMRERIYKSYDKKLAEHIIKFCGNSQTLRFTSSIDKANDIVAYFGFNAD